MKKLFKTILCLALTVSLCIAGCSMAFAQDSASDVSIDDLLALLATLTGDDSSGEETDVEVEVETDAAGTLIEMGSLSFVIPESWTVEEDDGMQVFYPDDFSSYTTAIYEEGSKAEIDIHDQDNIDALIASEGGEDVIDKMEYVTVSGHDAIWQELTMEGIQAYAIVIELDEALFALTLASLTEAGLDDFLNIVESMEIEGSERFTDLSAAFDGADVSAPTPAPAATDAAVEGIDVSATGEVVLIDDDVCTISMKNFSYDDYYALTAKVFTENKTDINLYYTIDHVSVNGYMVDPWWSTSVSSGHKSNSDMHFYQEDFDTNGISEVREIEFTIYVRDDDDWSADYLEEQTFVLYPFGTDVAEQPEQEFADDAVVLVDNDDCRMILTGYDTDNYYFKAYVYLENNTDIELEYRISGSTAVNGYEISPYFYREVQPGKKMNTYISWYLSDLEENDIDTIEDLELEINIQDANDWYADPVFSDIVSVEVE